LIITSLLHCPLVKSLQIGSGYTPECQVVIPLEVIREMWKLQRLEAQVLLDGYTFGGSISVNLLLFSSDLAQIHEAYTPPANARAHHSRPST